MNKFLFFLLIIVSTSLYAQKREKREGYYSAYLYSVDAPAGMPDVLIDTLQSSYEDGILSVKWKYGLTQIGFELSNKSEKTIRIIWDDAAFIGIDGETNKVFHKGVKFVDRTNPQPPTAIYRNSVLSDLVSPSSYTKYESGPYSGGWVSDPLIPAYQGKFSNKIEYVSVFIGQTLRVVLPIKVDENLREYIFNFRTTFVDTSKR